MLLVNISGEGNNKMAYSIGDRVSIIDEGKVNTDIYLEDTALAIIKKNRYSGEVTKIVDDIYFVGFKNELGWVTQGYTEDELKGTGGEEASNNDGEVLISPRSISPMNSTSYSERDIFRALDDVGLLNNKEMSKYE